MTIHARLTKLEPEKSRCELSSRSSDLKDLERKWQLPRDEYYDQTAEQDDQRRIEEKHKRVEHVKTYTPRVIIHPSFKNIGYQECVRMLQAPDVEIGDAIFRPSSFGTDHLTVTWKVRQRS